MVGLVIAEFLTQEKYPDTFVLTNGTDRVEIPNVKAEKRERIDLGDFLKEIPQTPLEHYYFLEKIWEKS